MKKVLSLLCFLTFFTTFAQNITGAWNGILDVHGNKLYLVFNIQKNGDVYSATLDSPLQGAKDIPVDRVSFLNNELKLELLGPKIVYTGKLENNEFIGNFVQSDFTFPMNLSQEAHKINRPQEPKAPFPYLSEDVTFKNTKENFELAGTLTLPQKTGKFPAVILISGSGQQDRNSEIYGHKSFWVIADYLTRNGIAVLRVDDRGMGQSKGELFYATSKNFADDVSAAVNYLKSRKEINTKKIGLIGHSEGGVIAPMVAVSQPKDIAFMVLMATSGVPGDEVILEQSRLIGKKSGMTDDQITKAMMLNKSIYDILKKPIDVNEKRNQIYVILNDSFNSSTNDFKPSETEQATLINEQIGILTSEWYMFFINHDPRTTLKNVKCPILILNGDKDLQVPATINVQAIKNTLEQSGNKNVTTKIFPNMNHLFQECTTCAIEEYSALEQTIAPKVLEEIQKWIAIQTH
jgi:alpha-beta hydrolase superfamily lysophospholipase